MRNPVILKIGLAAIAAAMFAGCTTTSSRITTTYYIISGSTGEDLDREIATKGPLKGHALASAAIKFVPVRIDYDESGGTCRFRDAKFRIDANITLPRWREQGFSRNRELRNAWLFLAEYARVHEENHIRIAEEYAAKIAKDLMALPPKKDCDSLDKAAEKILRKNKRDHDRAQNAFDKSEDKKLSELFED
jgi:predicted secreted Zn-dependent protease